MFGGPIRTLDGANPCVEAFAIIGGRIAAVGNMADVERDHRGPNTQFHDLSGHTAMPGLHDVHNHHQIAGKADLIEVGFLPTACPGRAVRRQGEPENLTLAGHTTTRGGSGSGDAGSEERGGEGGETANLRRIHAGRRECARCASRHREGLQPHGATPRRVPIGPDAECVHLVVPNRQVGGNNKINVYAGAKVCGGEFAEARTVMTPTERQHYDRVIIVGIGGKT